MPLRTSAPSTPRSHQPSTTPLTLAAPELRHYIYEAFQFTVELDRNTPEVRMKALVSSAFGAASDLDSIAATVAHKAIAGAGFEPATFGL